MNDYSIGQAPIGTPVSFDPHPGAKYATFSSLGPQNAHFAQPGELGTQHVIPLGPAPENPATRYDLTDAQKAHAQKAHPQKTYLAYLRQKQQEDYVRPAPGSWALNAAKRYSEAEAAWREAIRLDPGNSRAHHNLGVVLHESKRYPEAEAADREGESPRPR